VIDDSLRELIEQKTDSKKFLDDEKRRYDAEHRKVSFVSLFFRSDKFLFL